ncbi:MULTISPECIES: hypothetical protein [unclassified Acidovorax]|uniref:hypothetical protein n=1 Tax=unclassified Acidovorax TaxID=2684926 RepID=UPI001C43B870|nr:MULTISPECIES: hypothetical protein [unclassified Acidovorax]MBV7427277.1 hypothetical protein [Acidovorax sp. sif0732]MBV7448401.1 hypothetical protein [Acidovorax sp. sif0715]
MATAPQTHSSAGTTIGIAAGAPATWDNAGFDAQVFAKIGKIKNAGEFGKKFQLITSQYLDQRGEGKRKGTFNAGTLSLQVDILKGNAGQDLCQEALDSDDDYSFEVVLQNGRTFWVRGQVTSFPINLGGANDMTSSTITVELNPILLAAGGEVAALEKTP